VVGCSGRNPFKDKWPLRYKPGIKLLSASGGDQEFGPIINDLRNTPDFKVLPQSWDIVCEHGPSGPIQIAYLGYPYNFVSRATEAVPTPIVQLEIGGLLAALMQARIYLEITAMDPQQRRGIQRTAPSAQRFVYETWLKSMAERKIDIVRLFGYDSAILEATRNDRWFIEKTQPKPRQHWMTTQKLERVMEQILYKRVAPELLERETKPNLRAFGMG
jgi:hypothetical protein